MALCKVIPLHSQENILVGQTRVNVDTVYTGLDIPWEIIYGPDGKIWITERKGIVSRIDPVLKTKNTILNITSTVYQSGESGLLGMVLHPNFDIHPEVFLVYTYGTSTNIKERVVKYEYNGNQLVNEVILIDNIKGYSAHDGSRLSILADNTLLISTGDATDNTLSQNLNSLNGKFLRINLDGTIPANNPFAGSPVYSYGHRNAQGLLKGQNGIIYISEHGPASNDEFQILEAGRNYGWPAVEGFCDLSAEQTFCSANNVKEPLYVWTPTIAPSDMIFYENPDFPELDQRVLMTTLKGKRIIALKLNSNGTEVVDEDHYFTEIYGRLRDIAVGPEKEIYLATNGQFQSNTEPGTHSILRVKIAEEIGVDETLGKQQISLIVDNAHESLKVKISEIYLGKDLQIFDLGGKLIDSLKIKEEVFSVNLKKMDKGVYIVIISSANEKYYSQQIFKE